jgi:hypothetical protein
MTLFAFASVWYLAVIAVAAGSVWLGLQHRKAANAASLDECYEDRRGHERCEHMARVREEELAQMRRAAAHRRRDDVGAGA